MIDGVCRSQIEIVQAKKPLDFAKLWAVQPTQPLRILASDLQAGSGGATVFGSAEADFASLPELAACSERRRPRTSTHP